MPLAGLRRRVTPTTLTLGRDRDRWATTRPGRWNGMMRKVLMVAIPAIVVLLAGEALLPERTTSAQAQVPVFGDGPIPYRDPRSSNPFTSWSLFLVCNLEWLLEKRESDLREVFEAYREFGRTSGSHHAAVWFVKSKSMDQANPKNLDIERSVNYC